MSDIAQLHLGEAVFEFPVETSTQGQSAINFSTLLKQTGMTALDYGYGNTASTRSAITFIDGDAGILRYRGYPIEQIAEQSTFLESSYLSIYGELPTRAQLEDWTERIKQHSMLPEEMRQFFDSFPRDAHPMAVLIAGLAALAAFYPVADSQDPERIELDTVRLMAKVPTLAAFAHKRSVGQPYVYPDNTLDYESNFLRMVFSIPAVPYVVDPELAAAVRTLLILHVDHEQNCSTSTVRMVGSSHANIFASMAGGAAALWGPLHGGANQQVLEMLEQIRADGGDVAKAVARAKDKNDPFRLMGFGHRVYKNYDPRARVIKGVADRVISKLGGDDELLRIALHLEEVALSDPYFIDHKLYPNVDFYTGLIYRTLGFPTDMFTVMFALGRLPGWIAQWREQVHDPEARIGRPRQLYIGATERPYVPLSER